MKEIWIKIFEQEEQHDVMNYIISLDDDCLGNIPVILYCSPEHSQKRLPFAYSLSDLAVDVLKRKYGADNVKCVARRTVDNSFERIADALEGIQKSLDKLAACAGDTKGYGYRLYVAGDVDCEA